MTERSIDEPNTPAAAPPRGASDWWLYATRGIVVAMQALVFLVLAYVLTPEQFGRFAFGFAAARMAAAVMSLGLQGWLLRELPARSALGRPALRMRDVAMLTAVLPLALGLLLAVAGMAVPPVFAAFDGVESGSGRLVWSIACLGYALALTGVVGTLIRVGIGSLAGMAVQQALPFVVLLGVVAPTAFGVGLDVATVLLMSAGLLLLVLAGLVGLHGIRPWLPLARGGAALSPRVALRGSMPFWGNVLLVAATTQVDILIGAFFLSDAELGVYALIRNIAALVAMPRVIANWAVATQISRAWALEDRGKLERSVARGRRLSALPAGAGALLIVLLAPLWFALYDVPGDVIWPAVVLAALLAAHLATSLLGLSIIVASQCGLEGVTLCVRVISLALGAAVLAGAGLWFGPPGVALGVLVSTFTLNATMTWFVRRRTGVATF